MRSVTSKVPPTIEVGLTTDSASSTDAARYRSRPPVSQTIGRNHVSVVAPRMARPITTIRTRGTPTTTQPSQSGNNKMSSDCRMPPASPRYAAASQASLRLPLSARNAK